MSVLSRTRRVVMLVAAVPLVLTGAVVESAPVYADPADCPAPVATFAFGADAINEGQSTTLTWNITGTGFCSPNATGAFVVLYGPSTSQSVGASGSITVSSSMLGYGANAWSLYMGNTDGNSWFLADASLTMWPTPVAPGSHVTVPDSSAASRAQFLAGVMSPNTVVTIAGGVNLDLSNIENIPVAGGVQILGDTSTVPTGPRLFTTTVPATLLKIGPNSDHVRISGIRLEGGETDDPFSGLGPKDSDGIGVYSSQNVQIDHNEIYHWRGAGVNVHDGNTADDLNYLGRLNQDGVEDNTVNVWVHDNYFHHNQHPSSANCVDGSGHAGGYGVVVTDGAYAKIERNVFDWNRHSIAGDGKAGDGYVVRDNLILPNGGVHFKCVDPDSSLWVFVLNPFAGTVYVIAQALDPQHIYHTHAIDMHGVDNCSNGVFTGDLNSLGDHNCGSAGEYMDVEYNTILYTAGNGIHLRGYPQRALSSPPGTKVGMDVRGNVFAHTVHDGGFVTPGAILANDTGLNDLGNTLGLNAFNERKTCDFDGDGTADSFMGTGIGWWYQSSRLSGRWVFLGRASYRAGSVTLTDVNQDGRCDVIAGGNAYNNGSTDYNSPTLPLIANPGAQTTTAGTAVGLQVTATGSASRTWSVTGLPAGLSMTPFGRINGTPTTPGVSTVTVAVTDTFGQSYSTAFTWTVSPPPVAVPSVVGRDLGGAGSTLAAAGLNLGNETLVFDCTDVPGTVLAQSPAAGAVVLQGSAVNVSVSSLSDGRGRHCQLN